jgi:hypothetical protein
VIVVPLAPTPDGSRVIGGRIGGGGGRYAVGSDDGPTVRFRCGFASRGHEPNTAVRADNKKPVCSPFEWAVLGLKE